jgi:dTDP-4-dehydrorhamnose reductase
MAEIRGREMRVIVTGSRGRIGSALARRLAATPAMETRPFDRVALAIDDAAAVAAKLAPLDFDVLINAAALTGVDDCEADPARADAVNHLAPARLAALCAAKGARMVHISTDYVFDGVAPGPRHEDEEPRPLGVYGKSKRAGEVAVLAASPAHTVVRTSWVFGPDRPSFPDMVLDWARQRDEVRAIDDKWSSPCYSEDFAGWMLEVLARPGLAGVLHLCNDGACTWREYGQAVLELAAARGVPLRTRTVAPMKLAEMDHFTAVRPVHSALATGRFASATGRTPRPWREALAEFIGHKLATGG